MAIISKAQPADVPALLPLVADYWRYETIAGYEMQRVSWQLNRLLSEPHLGTGWIAIIDGIAVGYLLAVYVFSLEHLGVTAEIDELFVSSGQRGYGIAADLLKTAECEFARIGCTNVALQLASDNAGARAFYHRHGYMKRSRYEILDKMMSSTST